MVALGWLSACHGSAHPRLEGPTFQSTTVEIVEERIVPELVARELLERRRIRQPVRLLILVLAARIQGRRLQRNRHFSGWAFMRLAGWFWFLADGLNRLSWP